MSKRALLCFALGCAVVAAPVSAQLLGGGGPAGGGGLLGGGGGLLGGGGGLLGQVGGTVDRALGSATGPTGGQGSSDAVAPVSLDHVAPSLATLGSSASQLLDLRRARLDALVGANRRTLDRDRNGQPVRRGVLIATDPDPASLAIATSAGFRIVRSETVSELGLRMVTLAVPGKLDVRGAAKLLQRVAPRLTIDYDHLYEPAGGSLAPLAGAALAPMTGGAMPPLRPGTRLAMIDGGIAAHPSLARAAIDQRGFAGPAQPTGHGTAVGSLLVGNDGAFRGAAAGSHLFVADVYGGNAASGSATVIVRALAWAASQRPSVINISLVGPADALLQRAIEAVRARGIAVVAAVGNDGPAAPPQYPASYPGVIAVTGVDGKDRALREAGRASHLDFAAPGADLVAAIPGRGYAVVRGTSFAAPLVSARLAATGTSARLADEALPGKGAVGQGIICRACRILPAAVGLK